MCRSSDMQESELAVYLSCDQSTNVPRHHRLKGRCFAPRYRLAPQFPFPCAVQDVVSAYLYLLTIV